MHTQSFQGDLESLKYDERTLVVYLGEPRPDLPPNVMNIPCINDISAIDTILDAIHDHVVLHQYERLLFETPVAEQLFGDDGMERNTRQYITQAFHMMKTLRDPPLYRMDEAMQGTYGYSEQLLTTDELNTRMEIIDKLWMHKDQQ